MNKNSEKKLRLYVDALEKTNRHLMIALREMHKYTVSIEETKQELVNQLNTCEDPSGTAGFGRQLNESPVTARLLELIIDMPEEDQRILLEDLEAKLSNDTRKNTRKPFSMVVDYVAKDRICNDFIKDISAGGMFIENRMQFLVGQELLLTFPLPNNRKHIKIAARVIRTTPKGIGVKFIIAGNEQEEMIKSLLGMT